MKKRAFLCVGLGVLLSAGAAQADPVCSTVADCEQLISAAQARIQALQGVTLGPILRNPDGSIRLMEHHQAVSYCATRGGLPTIKQLALVLNLKGVSDTARPGFEGVWPKDEAYFYYNDGAYEVPTGDESPTDVEGNHLYWSSSVYVYNDYSAYVFNSSNGVISIGFRGAITQNAVRCLGR